MTRRGEKRKCTNGSVRDGQRRSPRLCHSGEGHKQPKSRSAVIPSRPDTSTSTRAASSKGSLRPLDAQDHQLLSLCNSHDEESDADLCLRSSKSKSSAKHTPKDFPALECPLHEVNGAVDHHDYSTSGKELDLQSVEGKEHKDDHGHRADESCLPEKRILELVLDILQRRDTYEIFAEPVDPSEVEEYYEIIKEPMDFGTMRAKLHEGMYKNLQQFERDIFLIFDNAMYFNSSATVYFRQARALEDLAKRVFLVLRTNPENFELEFASTKRRSNRKLYDELRGSNFGSCQKEAKDLGSNSMSTNVVQKGCRRERRTYMTGVDRRCTYKPWMFLLDETDSTLSPIHSGTKALIQVNQEKIGYKDSLMKFVRDLGPTAQRVAKHKLQNLETQAPSSPLINFLDPSNANKWQSLAAQSPFQREHKQSPSSTRATTTPVSCAPIDTKKAYDVGTTHDANKSREAPKEAKVVSTLGFSRFSDISAPTIWGSRSCSTTDQGNMSKKIVLGLASEAKSPQKANVSQHGVGFHVPAGKAAIKECRNTNNKSMTWLKPSVNTSPSPNKELKPMQVRNFDLNQVEVVTNSSHTNSCAKDDIFRAPVTPACGSLGVRGPFNSPFPAYHAMTEQAYGQLGSTSNVPYSSASQASQFTFNLPYLKSRLSEVNNIDSSISYEQARRQAALQFMSDNRWPFSGISNSELEAAIRYTNPN